MNDLFTNIKGEIDSFDIIVIGHLKYNPYFGETAEKPPRGDPSTCTSTMIRGKMNDGTPYVLLIDATLRNSPEEYYFDINRRTGLTPSDITHCFVTHSHFDHIAGLNYFENAVWCAHKTVCDELASSPHIKASKIKAVEGEFLPGVSIIHLPGHRDNLYGIAFMSGNKRVVVAADSVMTKGHFKHKTAMFEQNADAARITIQNLNDYADLIIPGHDNIIIK